MTEGLVGNEQLWWLVARSSGVVALVLVALSVIWGLLVSSKYLAGGPKPKGLLNLHRFLGALSVSFSAIHLLALYLDSYVTFTVTDLLVPLASSWKPFPVAAGVVAFWLLLAVQASSLVMKRLPRRWWKWIHLTSYLLLPLGIVHGVLAGTDAGTAWFQLGGGALVALVAWLTAWRAWSVTGRRGRSRRLPTADTAAVATTGPGQHRVAGSPRVPASRRVGA